MFEGRRVLALVPARSGSKGIRDKNLQRVRGISLIGWAGQTLAQVPFLDGRVLSTDDARYAAEGRRHGLDAPFVRPAALSTDAAPVVLAMQHALGESEAHYAIRFDIILLVEPTSPWRTAGDIERATRRLIATGADSVVTVSPLSANFHPRKLLTLAAGRVAFLEEEGRQVVARQELSGGLYWRNGVCYALTRACLMEHGAIFTAHTVAEIIDHPVVNIDDPFELVVAERLWDHAFAPGDRGGAGA
ncbi:MAG: cytidylyltransferase domain-containing protein [bacterium]